MRFQQLRTTSPLRQEQLRKKGRPPTLRQVTKDTDGSSLVDSNFDNVDVESIDVGQHVAASEVLSLRCSLYHRYSFLRRAQ